MSCAYLGVLGVTDQGALCLVGTWVCWGSQTRMLCVFCIPGCVGGHRLGCFVPCAYLGVLAIMVNQFRQGIEVQSQSVCSHLLLLSIIILPQEPTPPSTPHLPLQQVVFVAGTGTQVLWTELSWLLLKFCETWCTTCTRLSFNTICECE